MDENIEPAVAALKAAMPILADSFGKEEVPASVERVVGQTVHPDGPTKEPVLSALAGDLDDMGLRLLADVARDLWEQTSMGTLHGEGGTIHRAPKHPPVVGIGCGRGPSRRFAKADLRLRPARNTIRLLP
jgi:hypothetical protein